MYNIKKDIENNDIKQFYLLYGNESYLKNFYKNKLKKAIIGDDNLNLNKFDKDNMNIHNICDIISTLPFFGNKRLCIISDSELFLKADEEFYNTIISVPKSNHIIFIEDKVDKRNKLFKYINKNGYCSELASLDNKTLQAFVYSRIKAEKKKISKDNLIAFLSMTGNDLLNINNELAKLINYINDRDEITKEDINKVVCINLEDRIFDLISYITNKDSRAVGVYDELCGLKVAHMQMFIMIEKQFLKLYRIKQLCIARVNKLDIQNLLNISDKAAYVLMNLVANMDISYLSKKIKECEKLEAAIKSGDIDVIYAVEMLIFEK